MNHFRYLFAWIVSLIATFGSLYFSEIKGYIPCTLCWYQRILMYPLVILLGIYLIKKDRDISIYILPFSLMGFLLATYHYSIQKFPIFHLSNPCPIGISCSGDYINWFNFITIPFLSLSAFLLITILVSKKR
ncbi:MAG: disulfide oxidoreductase [Bacillota bacterium]|uniref:Probable disulfide formation protein n=1 Tax=Peribacillus simplex TaxID=1478 RepID=A0A9X8ZG91_9BACI|nr:disulfide oxidoreductase [Peribacillus simplex]TKH10676.1 disulfide bond formation protein B [Peribacillus simplex]